jgi:hypothetical protein
MQNDIVVEIIDVVFFEEDHETWYHAHLFVTDAPPSGRDGIHVYSGRLRELETVLNLRLPGRFIDASQKAIRAAVAEAWATRTAKRARA